MAAYIVEHYQTLVRHIPELIDVSGYRNDYIARKMGLRAANFSVKKQRGNWTSEEVSKLINIIDNEDVDDFLMLQMMRETKGDETVSYKNFKKEMGWS